MTNVVKFNGYTTVDIDSDYGKPINMNVGDKFIVRLNDDFSGLVSHTFGLRGIKY